MENTKRKITTTAKKRDATGNAKAAPEVKVAPEVKEEGFTDLSNPVVLVARNERLQTSKDPPPPVKFTLQAELQGIKFFSSDLVGKDSKIDQRHLYAKIDDNFPKIKARALDLAPFMAGLNLAEKGLNILTNANHTMMANMHGMQSIRANLCAREGRYYYEVKVINGMVPAPGKYEPQRAMPHVRFGWSRREAEVDKPVGASFYSYGIRDVTGESIWAMKPTPVLGGGKVEQFAPIGTVIGLLITLPSLDLHRKIVNGTYNKAVDLPDETGLKNRTAANIIRDRLVVSNAKSTMLQICDYKANQKLEKFHHAGQDHPPEFSIPRDPNHPMVELRTLPESSIKIYKNGTLVGTAFENLLTFLPLASKPEELFGVRHGMDDGDLGYFPTLSACYGGALEINCGPNFWFPPQGLGEKNERGVELEPIGNRYDEQVAESCLWDIVDEVCLDE